VRKGFLLINPKKKGYIMCRLRCFYFELGTWGWAEIVLSYDDDIAGHIRHWSTGGRMVISEHIDMV
jgi:hypothetical protein